MISLLLLTVAAGAANIALVAFMADRLGPKAGTTAAAGEFIAITERAPAAAKSSAVRIGNENVPAGAANLAA